MPNMDFRGDQNELAVAIDAVLRAGHAANENDNNNNDNVRALQRNAVLMFFQSFLPWANYGTDLRGEDIGGDGAGTSDAEENNDHN